MTNFRKENSSAMVKSNTVQIMKCYNMASVAEHLN